MMLTPNFSVEEFVRSATAARMGINNDLPLELVENAKKTAAKLERIRTYLSGRARGRIIRMRITSGYRCPALNAAVGSGPYSDHILAAAADWEAPDYGSPTTIALALAGAVEELGIGQLINEYPDRDGWVHTSFLVPQKLVNRIITIKRTGITVGITG